MARRRKTPKNAARDGSNPGRGGQASSSLQNPTVSRYLSLSFSLLFSSLFSLSSRFRELLQLSNFLVSSAFANCVSSERSKHCKQAFGKQLMQAGLCQQSHCLCRFPTFGSIFIYVMFGLDLPFLSSIQSGSTSCCFLV